MSGPPLATCVACGAPAFTKCRKCDTDYCNKKCQFDDWPRQHRSDCPDLQTEKFLKRAAVIVQAVYFKFSEQAWSAQVHDVSVSVDKLTIYCGLPAQSGVLTKFSDDLITDPGIKAAVLCSLTNHEPLDLLQVLNNRLINPPKSWYIDVIGAPHGLNQTLWDHRDFNNTYVVGGRPASFFATRPSIASASSPDILKANSCAKTAIDNWIRIYQDKLFENKKKLPDNVCSLLKIGDKEFEAEKEVLLELMDQAIDDYVAKPNFTEEL